MGKGGGLVRLEVIRRLTLSGTIMANGFSGVADYAGGGAGGGIRVECKRLSGSGGLLSANGGAGTSANAAGGGGGRIAVWRGIDEYAGSLTTNVEGGVGTEVTSNYKGISGTSILAVMQSRPTAALIIIR
jgi:hypothetical protein